MCEKSLPRADGTAGAKGTRHINAGTGSMTGSVQAAQDEMAVHARRHASWIIRLARAGYAAKGIVYIVIGALAVKAAAGAGGRATDSSGAMGAIGGSTGGRALLLLMGIGLAGYALWAVASAFLDAEDRGDEAKGIALRVGQAARGLAYGALGLEALALVARSGGSGGGGGAEHWTARAMALPWGRALVGLAGAGIIAYALYQLWRGARKNLQKRLRLGAGNPETVRWLVRLARFGVIARGVVFLMIGWLVLQAAWRSDAEQAGGIGDSLSALGTQPYGSLVLGVAALGLIAYGVWQLANARYREMHVS